MAMDMAGTDRSPSSPAWACTDGRLWARTEHHDSYVLVRVDGELDFLSAEAFREYVLSVAEPTRRVVLDLEGMSFCDSSGLGALVGVWKFVHARGGRLVLARPTDMCRRILQRTGLDGRIDVSETLGDGRAWVTVGTADFDVREMSSAERRYVS
ncbi:STAS domain-containing protein [Actinomadura fibrosa]|uniref:Anti-sigma factor antagonist n=1 Tax=Actinomadura fibrosa TaxID=111802 RepID=A0ABW2XN28_9ACTN|nr:STAS domain-containing protein [Actinomadura fibrosa]